MPIEIVNKLKGWNTHSEKATSPFYDRRFTIAMLLMCVSTDDLANHNLNATVKDFIYGMYHC